MCRGLLILVQLALLWCTTLGVSEGITGVVMRGGGINVTTMEGIDFSDVASGWMGLGTHNDPSHSNGLEALWEVAGRDAMTLWEVAEEERAMYGSCVDDELKTCNTRLPNDTATETEK